MEVPVQKTPPRTLEDYFELETESADGLRHEYHGDGCIVAMAGGSIVHSTIGLNVTSALQRLLEGKPCRAFNGDARVLIKTLGRYYYPDASALCGEIEIDRRNAQESICNPQMILEVLSPSTERLDRNTKFDAYMLIESLREYVLIEQDEPRATVFSRHPDGSRRFASFVGLDAVLDLPSLSIKIPLQAIYANVEFPPPPPAKRVVDA